MLLNLSNHPFNHWPDSQRKEAIKQFKEVEDLAFPHVDPAWKTDEIAQLAEEFEIRVRKTNPQAVHLMGELTFCFALVIRLQKAGIPCLASTTKRAVRHQPNGEIIRKFEFVRFRYYSA